ncbi:MAG: TIR domain-containing protein [bacterium]|nr:TIR domain-containing protein [bacterium]
MSTNQPNSSASPPQPRVFLCYSEEDFEQVEKLYDQMQAAGWRPWLDERDILPGEKRKQAIEDAIADSDFFLACVSDNVARRRGRVQKEIRDALDVLQNLLEDDIYLIPVLLEACALPERLKEFQPVRLYREGGFDNLIRALNAGLHRRMREHADSDNDAPGGGAPTIQLESKASGPDQAQVANAPGFDFRFYKLLAGAHDGLENGRPRQTSAYLQQCTILLLRLVYRKSHGEAEARSAPVKQLIRHLRATTRDLRILKALRKIIQQCHLVSHDLDEAISRKRSGNLLIEFIAVWFWFQKNVLDQRQPEMLLIREALTTRANPGGDSLKLTKERFIYSEESESLVAPTDANENRSQPEADPDEADASGDTSQEIPRIALHQAALKYSRKLESWQKFLANLACFQLRTELEIPYVEIHKHSEEIELSFVTVCQSVTSIIARLKSTYVILYIGPPVSVNDWCRRHQISTNLEDFIEVFETPVSETKKDRRLVHLVSRAPDLALAAGPENDEARSNPPTPGKATDMSQLAPEIKEAAFNDIDSETYAEYKATSRASTGFIQSNIALLNDDHDLFQALSYPMDTWRLFLHPLQSKVTAHPAQIMFIQGGPGTGKTVVLAHRIAHAIQKREQSDRNFKVVFLAFTKSVAANMRDMLEKLNVDPGRILIEDVRDFFARKTRGELGLKYEDRKLIYWELFRGRQEKFRVTDVFFDEFQDFPTRDEDNYIIKIIRAVQASGATLTCTYDEHQSIYHTETDLAFWDQLLEIKHQKLSYCYRMAREISEIAYDHRRIMLEHAEDMIRMSTGKAMTYQVQRTPNYAFGGGTVHLVPSVGIRQISVAKKIVTELRKVYAYDEVVIIFFDPQNYGRRHTGRLTPGWYDKLKKDLLVDIYNPFAIKGLEFRAGVVLFPQYCFMKYYMYLRDGVTLKRLDEFCDVMIEYYAKYLAGISYLRFQSDTGPLDDLVYFLNSRPNASVRSEDPGIRFIVDALQEKEITGALLGQLHDMYNRFLSHDFKSLILKYDVPGDRRYQLDAIMFERLQQSLEANNEKIKRHTRFRRARMIHTDIDHSLRDLNEFYVALTRFREKAFLIYDQEYDLAEILPGAEILDEDRLFDISAARNDKS